jgi:cell division protein ZapD
MIKSFRHKGIERFFKKDDARGINAKHGPRIRRILDLIEEATAVVQMVGICLPQDSQFIPEISANKYALNIRFAIFGDDARPHTSTANVEFELTLCNL